jgi:hypothetical protein
MNIINNSTTINLESWFISINIVVIVSLILAILLAIIFLVIVSVNRACQTIPMMLAGNSCLAEIVYGSSMLSIALFTLENDMKQILFQDSLCNFRGYLGYVGNASLLYSFTLQAMYRYIVVVYPTRIAWQSAKVQGLLVCCSWIFSIGSLLPWLFTGDIIYIADNQLCALPFQLSVPILYNMLLTYIIPILIIMLIYLKLFLYVRQIGLRATSIQTMFRARRELIMVRRIFIIIIFLLIIGLPYCIFVFMSFITNPPKYYYRISLFFVDIGQTFVMIALFCFSQPLMDIVQNFRRLLVNIVQPATT